MDLRYKFLVCFLCEREVTFSSVFVWDCIGGFYDREAAIQKVVDETRFRSRTLPVKFL
jgi:hypothetical protein